MYKKIYTEYKCRYKIEIGVAFFENLFTECNIYTVNYYKYHRVWW